MEHLNGILKLADKELEAIEQNGKFRSREEVDSVYKLIDIVKDIYEVWCMEDDMDDESYEGRSYRDSYGGGSYASGRGRNAKRYAGGRYAPYSRDGESYRGGMRGSYRGYSRDGNDDYVGQLHDLMERAPDDQTRQSIQRMIQNMGQ